MIELLYAGVLVGLGIYNWRIASRLYEAELMLDEYNELILNMAVELEELGSPNIKITKNEVS